MLLKSRLILFWSKTRQSHFATHKPSPPAEARQDEGAGPWRVDREP